jgi:hypothetical protein
LGVVGFTVSVQSNPKQDPQPERVTVSAKTDELPMPNMAGMKIIIRENRVHLISISLLKLSIFEPRCYLVHVGVGRNHLGFVEECGTGFSLFFLREIK